MIPATEMAEPLSRSAGSGIPYPREILVNNGLDDETSKATQHWGRLWQR